ncbi:hypothetical protein [Rhizorhabdus dicambivorans]|uniref:YtxH domain-containing protein n=1 Tax=Rhizorhabdus dicambivorans TaxID=1850238 RepID=A0A2A4FVZ9_9SPHN|nr:hypothetical protein [Rhizorhabdus dicambivorans]ATE65300.1 hypothetical protein CMV14_13530 [Rhizorhabdus dicambivorans]PCE42374.1 hypothetical protein COO09_10250 [Rhizorhabdus dicambivorans]
MTTQKNEGQGGQGEGRSGIKQRAAQAKDYAGEKLRSGGDAARAAGRKVAGEVDAFPVAALVGGLAVGAVLGALLPRTRQEEQLLGSIGGAINERAKDAMLAARDAGQAKLDELGISSDAAGKQVGRLIDSLGQVAESAGSAAIDAVRH